MVDTKRQFTHDDKKLFLVMMMDEEPQLTCMLKAAAYYRKQFPGKLPSIVGSARRGRLTFKFGDAARAHSDDIGKFTLLDAIYMGLYHPFDDGIVSKRDPTPTPSKRHPIPLVYEYPKRKDLEK